MDYFSLSKSDENKLKKQPLSDRDIIYMMNKPIIEIPGVNIQTFRDLEKFESLEELLGSPGRCALLYETTDDYGHWCSIFENSRGIVFFDPYGTNIDRQLSYIPRRLKTDTHGRVYPYTLDLLADYAERNPGRQVEYNQQHLQSDTPGIATCGKWSCIRMYFNELNEHEFFNMINNMSKVKDVPRDNIVVDLYEYFKQL